MTTPDQPQTPEQQPDHLDEAVVALAAAQLRADEALAELEAAKQKRAVARDAVDAARSALAEQIRIAAARRRQVDIVKATGYTREYIRRIVEQRGTQTVSAGEWVRLEGVPFEVNVLKPSGEHEIEWTFNQRLCGVVVDGHTNLAAPASMDAEMDVTDDSGAERVRVKLRRVARGADE